MDTFKQKKEQYIRLLAFLLVIALASMLTACGKSSSDKIERFAEANPGSGESIAIPGYEKLIFEAGKKMQTVDLRNPAENACTFILSLTLDDGRTLWTGEALSPGEAFTSITISKALDTGEYAAKLHYDCYSLNDNTPLNGAEIQLIIEVK